MHDVSGSPIEASSYLFSSRIPGALSRMARAMQQGSWFRFRRRLRLSRIEQSTLATMGTIFLCCRPRVCSSSIGCPSDLEPVMAALCQTA